MKQIIEEKYRKSITDMLDIEKSYHETIKQLSREAGAAHKEAWKIIYDIYPELKNERMYLNCETWELCQYEPDE